MARRTKRRGTTPPRKRPGAQPTARSQPLSSAVPEPGAQVLAEQSTPEVQTVAPAPVPTAARPRASGLPRRGASTQTSGPGPQPVAATPVAAVPAPSESLLPRRTGAVGRAEIRRRQEANLEPLDDSPAVPLDRTPYLPLDIRRVAFVSTTMLALVIVAFIFLH